MLGGLIIVISKEITVKVCHVNYKYYEDKGYHIEKSIDKQGRFTTPDQLQQYLDKNRPYYGLDKISLYEITGAESHFYDSFLIA